MLQKEVWLFPSLEAFHEHSVFMNSMPEKSSYTARAKAFDAYERLSMFFQNPALILSFKD